MRLTCPTCETAYEVPAGQIPDEGRHVQCSTCHTRWFARRPPEPEPSEEQIIYRLETRIPRHARPEPSGAPPEPAAGPPPAFEAAPEQPEGDFHWETASPAGAGRVEPLRAPGRDLPRFPRPAPPPEPSRPAPQAAPAATAPEPAVERPSPAPDVPPASLARAEVTPEPVEAPPVAWTPAEMRPEPAIELLRPVPEASPVQAPDEPAGGLLPAAPPQAPAAAAPGPAAEPSPAPSQRWEVAPEPPVELPPPEPAAISMQAAREPAIEVLAPEPRKDPGPPAGIVHARPLEVLPPTPRKDPVPPADIGRLPPREVPRPPALDLRRAEIAPPPPRPAEVPRARALPGAAEPAAPARQPGPHLRLDVTDAQVMAWEAEERRVPRSRFGRGVFVALVLFGAALGLYLFGGRLAAMTPMLAPAIEAYVAAIDRLREAMLPGNDAGIWPALRRWTGFP